MRYFLSVLAIVLVLVISIIVIARSGGNTSRNNAINVANYGTNLSSAATETTYGYLVGENQRVAVQVVVNPSTRTINILSGYENNVVNTQTYSNTPAAYQAFLGGLANAGFELSKPTSQVNMFGVCPLGDTYTYELNNGEKDVINSWSTSCRASDGTFKGSASLVLQLFQMQIPNYFTFTNNLQNISL